MDYLEIIFVGGSALMMIIGILTCATGCSSHFFKFIYEKKDEIREFQNEITLSVEDFKRKMTSITENNRKGVFANGQQLISIGIMDNNTRREKEREMNNINEKFNKIKNQITIFRKNVKSESQKHFYNFNFPFFYNKQEEIKYINRVKELEKNQYNDPEIKCIRLSLPMYEKDTDIIWKNVYEELYEV